ncbi:hypothetical protein AgCh_025549 [Apium graveolens]
MLEDAAVRSNSYQEVLCPSQLRDADVSTSGGNTSCANDETSMNDSLMMVFYEQRAPGYCSRCVDNIAMRSKSNHFSDNGGYTIEVEIHDGPYNMIKNWHYTVLVDAIHNGEGKCWKTKVRCEKILLKQ